MIKNLIEMKFGEEGIIKDISEFKREFNDIGIYRGQKIRMMSKPPIRNNLIVSTRGSKMIISPEMAMSIIVEPDKPREPEGEDE